MLITHLKGCNGFVNYIDPASKVRILDEVLIFLEDNVFKADMNSAAMFK